MIQLINRLKSKKGFTLIELIVVIAIIAILILIAVPLYQGFVDRAQVSADEASAETIIKAALIYIASDIGADPTVADLVAEGLIADPQPSQSGGPFVLGYGTGEPVVTY